MFLSPYQPLHTALKYFWYLSYVQCSNIFRGILTMTKNFLKRQELQDALALIFWVALVPIWIFACSTILSGCTCCDVHITMATDALRRSSFYVDVHTTSHWSSTCPLQQHTESSRAQVICQSRRQLIEMIPVTVEQITRTTAICKRKKYLGFNIQSSKQAPWQVQEPFSY